MGVWLVGEGGAILLPYGSRPRALLLHPDRRFRPSAVGPHRAPAPGAAHRRGGLRHCREPLVLRRGLAGAAEAAEADAPGAGRGGPRLGASLASLMGAHIVIAGGGFGGLYAARRLERRLPRHAARITLVSDVNFLLYTPLLPGAGAGSLEPRHVVVPLREETEWTDIRLARVTGADPGVNELSVTTLDGRDEVLRYDQLIVALGSVPRILPVPGLAEHGVGFKTLPDAIALRNRAILHLEIAESIDDPELRRPWLTFVFVGAGYAGLEGIAELQDYVADIDRPLSALPPRRDALHPGRGRGAGDAGDSREAGRVRHAELRGRGMEIRTRTRLEGVTEDTAVLSTGERVPARTLCWTAGVRPSPVIAEARACRSIRGGRIQTDAHHAGGRPRERVGDRRRRRGARSGAQGPGQPAHRAARPAPGQGGGRQRGGGDRRAPAAQVPLPHARGVRGHGPAPGGGDHARRSPERLPGLVRGPHVPPDGDAGNGRGGCGS